MALVEIGITPSHNDLAEWVGALANMLLAVVAVGVVFLQRWLEWRRNRQRLAYRSFLAITHAQGGLLHLRDLWSEASALMAAHSVRAFQPVEREHHRFELSVAEQAIDLALGTGLEDPALIEHLVKVREWLRGAQLSLETSNGFPTSIVGHLNESAEYREAADRDLASMQRQFLKWT